VAPCVRGRDVAPDCRLPPLPDPEEPSSFGSSPPISLRATATAAGTPTPIAAPAATFFFIDVPSAFHPEFDGNEEDGYSIEVELGSVDRQVIAVLDTLEAFVNERSDGPARVVLDGRNYTVHPQA
jgi:hypothetical protein